MAMDMFIKFEPDVPGESQDSAHKDEIDVLAWSWGASNSGSAHSGGGAGSGKVNVQDLSFTKYVDKASPDLLQKVCDGTHFTKATLIVRKAGGTSPLEYLTITMGEKVFVTSASTGGSGGEDRLTENVTLSFATVQVDYKEQTADGGVGATPSAGWNIAANTKL
jgi:type VI secretion system secreted protein Hcp